MTTQSHSGLYLAIQDFRRARRQASLERIMARLTGKSADLLSYEDVRHKLDMETDYEQEAENLRIGRAAFAEDEGIVVPQVFPEVSTRRVLTMEYVDGLHLDKFLTTDPPQELRDQFGHKIGK